MSEAAPRAAAEASSEVGAVASSAFDGGVPNEGGAAADGAALKESLLRYLFHSLDKAMFELYTVLEYECNLLYTEAALRGLQTAVNDFDELRERIGVILGASDGGNDGETASGSVARASKSSVAWAVRTHSLSLMSALPGTDAVEPAINAMIGMLLERMRGEQQQQLLQQWQLQQPPHPPPPPPPPPLPSAMEQKVQSMGEITTSEAAEVVIESDTSLAAPSGTFPDAQTQLPPATPPKPSSRLPAPPSPLQLPPHPQPRLMVDTGQPKTPQRAALPSSAIGLSTPQGGTPRAMAATSSPVPATGATDSNAAALIELLSDFEKPGSWGDMLVKELGKERSADTTTVGGARRSQSALSSQRPSAATTPVAARSRAADLTVGAGIIDDASSVQPPAPLRRPWVVADQSSAAATVSRDSVDPRKGLRQSGAPASVPTVDGTRDQGMLESEADASSKLPDDAQSTSANAAAVAAGANKGVGKGAGVIMTSVVVGAGAKPSNVAAATAMPGSGMSSSVGAGAGAGSADLGTRRSYSVALLRGGAGPPAALALKLLAPERGAKPPPEVTAKLSEQKLRLAEANRVRLESARRERLAAKAARFAEATGKLRAEAAERESSLTDRHSAAEERYVSALAARRHRAEEESAKVQEVTFINTMTTEARRAELSSRAASADRRKASLLEDIRARSGGHVGRIAETVLAQRERDAAAARARLESVQRKLSEGQERRRAHLDGVRATAGASATPLAAKIGSGARQRVASDSISGGGGGGGGGGGVVDASDAGSASAFTSAAFSAGADVDSGSGVDVSHASVGVTVSGAGTLTGEYESTGLPSGRVPLLTLPTSASGRANSTRGSDGLAPASRSGPPPSPLFGNSRGRLPARAAAAPVFAALPAIAPGDILGDGAAVATEAGPEEAPSTAASGTRPGLEAASAAAVSVASAAATAAIAGNAAGGSTSADTASAPAESWFVVRGSRGGGGGSKKPRVPEPLPPSRPPLASLPSPPNSSPRTAPATSPPPAEPVSPPNAPEAASTLALAKSLAASRKGGVASAGTSRGARRAADRRSAEATAAAEASADGTLLAAAAAAAKAEAGADIGARARAALRTATAVASSRLLAPPTTLRSVQEAAMRRHLPASPPALPTGSVHARVAAAAAMAPAELAHASVAAVAATVADFLDIRWDCLAARRYAAMALATGEVAVPSAPIPQACDAASTAAVAAQASLCEWAALRSAAGERASAADADALLAVQLLLLVASQPVSSTSAPAPTGAPVAPRLASLRSGADAWLERMGAPVGRAVAMVTIEALRQLAVPPPSALDAPPLGDVARALHGALAAAAPACSVFLGSESMSEVSHSIPSLVPETSMAATAATAVAAVGLACLVRWVSASRLSAAAFLDSDVLCDLCASAGCWLAAAVDGGGAAGGASSTLATLLAALVAALATPSGPGGENGFSGVEAWCMPLLSSLCACAKAAATEPPRDGAALAATCQRAGASASLEPPLLACAPLGTSIIARPTNGALAAACARALGALAGSAGAGWLASAAALLDWADATSLRDLGELREEVRSLTSADLSTSVASVSSAHALAPSARERLCGELSGWLASVEVGGAASLVEGAFEALVAGLARCAKERRDSDCVAPALLARVVAAPMTFFLAPACRAAISSYLAAAAAESADAAAVIRCGLSPDFFSPVAN